MTTLKKSSSPLRLILISLLILFVGCAMCGTYRLLNYRSANVKKMPATEQKINSDAKRALVENTKSTPSQSTSKSAEPTSTSTVEDTTSAHRIELSSKQESNNTVTVIGKLYGYSDGICSLLATNSGKENSQTAPVIYQAEFSSCAGFSVPVSNLGTGTWNIKLTVASGGVSKSMAMTLGVN